MTSQSAFLLAVIIALTFAGAYEIGYDQNRREVEDRVGMSYFLCGYEAGLAERTLRDWAVALPVTPRCEWLEAGRIGR